MKSKNLILAAGGLGTLAGALLAGPRSSANYSVVTEIMDGGGSRTASANYTHDGSLAAIAGVSTATAPTESLKAGYIAQLYAVTGFALTSASTHVDEGATLQLGAGLALDDATLLAVAPASVSWSVASGPLDSIGTTGLATAAIVYDDTNATAQGIHLGQTATLALTVKNAASDNFGNYAGDGLHDTWQVRYFGLDSPQAAPGADPDGDGDINSDEYNSLTDPTDAASNAGSLFRVTSVSLSGGDLVISFATLVGRAYTLEGSGDLAPGSWSNTGLPPPMLGNGTILSVAIPAPPAGPPGRFYRIQVGP